jgi:4'-phosphopantetheinyl transferase
LHSITIKIFPLRSDSERYEKLFSYLSVDEQGKAARFRFDLHRNRFVTGRGTLREILAEQGKCGPGSIRFAENHLGKPSIVAPTTLQDLRFSVSGSEDTGGVAFARNIAVGFDLEHVPTVNKITTLDSIAAQRFTRHEYRDLQKRREGDFVRHFYMLWTAKEAYLKGLGIGLSGGLDSFSVGFDGRRPFIFSTTLEEMQRSSFVLQQFWVAGACMACLAHEDRSFGDKRGGWPRSLAE